MLIIDLLSELQVLFGRVNTAYPFRWFLCSAGNLYILSTFSHCILGSLNLREFISPPIFCDKCLIFKELLHFLWFAYLPIHILSMNILHIFYTLCMIHFNAFTCSKYAA